MHYILDLSQAEAPQGHYSKIVLDILSAQKHLLIEPSKIKDGKEFSVIDLRGELKDKILVALKENGIYSEEMIEKFRALPLGFDRHTLPRGAKILSKRGKVLYHAGYKNKDSKF